MRKVVADASADKDSVGGTIECGVVGVKAGIGEPMFDGIEGRIAKAVFGIPAMKGIEFGKGFDLAKMRGSESNDNFRYDEKEMYILKQIIVVVFLVALQMVCLLYLRLQ